MFCHGVGFLTPQNEKTDQNPGTVAAMAGRLPWAVAALLAWATIMGKSEGMSEFSQFSACLN